MALNKGSLQSGIKKLLTDMQTREDSSIEEFSKRLSELIDSYVKTATIKYDGGLSAPNGPVNGTFKGKLE